MMPNGACNPMLWPCHLFRQRDADRQAAASASRLARLKRQRQASEEGAGTDQKRNRRMFGLLNSALKAGGAKTERGKIAEARQKEVAENRIKVRALPTSQPERSLLTLVASRKMYPC